MKKNLKKKNTMDDAWKFTRMLAGDIVDMERKEPFEPRNNKGRSEAVCQKEIINLLREEEAKDRLVYARINNTGIYDVKKGAHRAPGAGFKVGFPDIIVHKNRRTIYLEVKSSEGYQKPGQIEWQERVEAQGIEYYIVRSARAVEQILQFEVDV